ncbi:MAG: oligopeptide/dipeptide ABC transporter ATP-binding protein, partial [Candidatus Kapaibacterium sp.]
MEDLQKEFGMSYLFIAHDLSVVYHISQRIAVMYLGSMVEIGSADNVYFDPTHPYSRALISAVPEPDPTRRDKKRIVLQGDIPTPLNKPSGCGFRTRCPMATPDCAAAVPALALKNSGALVACPLVD